MVGYALTRYKFKGKKLFMGFLLASQFIPAAVLLVPLFNIFQGVGLVGTKTAIVLVNITFHIPFNAILMKGFIEGIPFELEEAAMVDGDVYKRQPHPRDGRARSSLNISHSGTGPGRQTSKTGSAYR